MTFQNKMKSLLRISNLFFLKYSIPAYHLPRPQIQKPVKIVLIGNYATTKYY